MDLEEWEFLSNDGSCLVDFHDHYNGGRKENRFFSTPNSVINMNYFICQPPPPPPPPPQQPLSQNLIKPTLVKAKTPNNLDLEHIPVLLGLDPTPQKAHDVDFLEKIKGPPPPLIDDDQESDHNQVSFKKVKENEFVDMKLDSPKSNSCSKGITLQIGPVKYQFDHKGDAMETTTKPFSPKMRSENEMMTMISPSSPKMKSGADMDSNWDDKQERFNLWKWSLNGVGTLCSVSVAAATICILIFGKTQSNQKLNFEIFTDDKRMKNVVEHASRLNETISSLRGAQLSRAHITFGGHYNAI